MTTYRTTMCAGIAALVLLTAVPMMGLGASAGAAVPVDGFWSISVYNEKGFFEKNDLASYSMNSLTAKPGPDGSYTIQFGGCTK